MRPFRFVHAADLHLDSPFKGLSARDPKIAEFLRKAAFLAFDNLVTLCIEKGVDFLLIAGDVFDRADRGLKAQMKFRDGLLELGKHGIRVFVVFGNHDPLSGRASPIDWPENVHFFGPNEVEDVMVERSGTTIASVSGISYCEPAERRNLAKKFKSGPGDLFRIGLLHTNIGGERDHEPYAPCEISDLVNTGIDYWALGHVHEKKVLCRDPYVVYPGNTQGRNIKEQGERGCFLVSVDDHGGVSLDFRPLDAARWASTEVDIGPFDSMDRLEAAIFSAIDTLLRGAEGRPIICRLSLTGRGPLYRELRRNRRVDDLAERARENFISKDPFAWVEGLFLDCTPEIDIERRRQVDDFVGFMLRKADQIQGSREAQRVLFDKALHPLFLDNRVRKAIGEPTPDEMKEILKEAELLCLDMLEGGDT